MIDLPRFILVAILSLLALPASAADPRLVVVPQSIPPLKNIPRLQTPSSHIGEAPLPLSDDENSLF
jgi:hypothetical protein